MTKSKPKPGRPFTIDWSKWDRKLGTVPDIDIARAVGCSQVHVTNRRIRLGIPSHRSTRHIA